MIIAAMALLYLKKIFAFPNTESDDYVMKVILI